MNNTTSSLPEEEWELVKEYRRAESLREVYLTGSKMTHYCPGCGHGQIHRILADQIDYLGIRERTVIINPVGCAVFVYYYLKCDHIQVPHGRGPAVAAGAKRYLSYLAKQRGEPEPIVISYQGDGDLACIGTAEIIHAANRGDNITVIFVNNAVYGMTGGQMAPTTLPGQVTTTTPSGRRVEDTGMPLPVSEMLSVLKRVAFVQRTSLYSTAEIRKTEKAIRKALQYQMENKGFTFVEILSNCPTNWKMTPKESFSWIKNEMTKYFPLGVFKDIGGKEEKA